MLGERGKQLENSSAELDNEQNTTELVPSTKDAILDIVASSSVIFQSQQKDDPELSFEEKRKIAETLLGESHALFLSKFGKCLNLKLLEFFGGSLENYEVAHHMKKLKRFFDSSTRQIDRKNRRYEALKMLIEKGEYFSEIEMMRRNPLLYDNLIGKYLTEEQKKTRDNLDTTNITFVNLLMEKIDRDKVKLLRKNQEDAEDEVLEENDSDSDEEICESSDEENRSRNCDKWGEMTGKGDTHEINERVKKKISIVDEISYEEQQMLRQEFITHMYQSFLNGKDTDFDYSTVDDNEAYDNVNLREKDEEEKYFDSESPDFATPSKTPELEKSGEESEDELDKYMKSLKVIS